MNDLESLPAFERRLRELLERQAETLSAHVRSGLTQARHAALAQAIEPRAWPTLRAGRRLWVPATGALAALAAGVMLLRPHRAARTSLAAQTTALTAQDVRLLSDRDSLAMLEDGDGQFYEWAAAQARGPAAPAAAEGPGEHGG